MKPLFALMTLLVAPTLLADEPRLDLKEIERKLKEAPDDPVLHYRKCQALFASGKEQEAVRHAEVAMAKFKRAKKNLSWMRLGSFKTKRYRVDVHFNLGPGERAEQRDGIVRPYSFRVWTLGEDPGLTQILDFELGYSDGKAVTAAIGETTNDGHANYGIVDPNSDYASIKRKIVELLTR